MLYRAYSATCVGLDVIPVTVEVSVQQGVGIFLVGLPDCAVKESLMRVTTALKSRGFEVPGKKTIINLAPANIRKEGSSFDAAIAAGLLAAAGQFSFSVAADFLILGELSLDGRMRSVQGALPMAIKGAELGFKACIFPADSAWEAEDVDGIDIFGAEDVMDMIAIINGEPSCSSMLVEKSLDMPPMRRFSDDFKDVAGQEFAKRGLEIAASGGHNVLLNGPPGAGKSFMSRCLASILPPMGRGESLETSAIYSVAGLLTGRRGLITERPFISVHHSCSAVSLIGGGGARAIPGAVSLAHNGVLFLDEISLFSASMLNMLRQPLEDRKICISRAKYKVQYPSSFMLVGSMNPCPCGYYGEDGNKCTCTPGMIARYLSKLSGPLLDRIDLSIRVKPVAVSALVSGKRAESSADIAVRVAAARKVQEERFAGEEGTYSNAQMNSGQIGKYCPLGGKERAFIDSAITKLSLSARAYSRILKISRTIADMEGAGQIEVPHIAEALQFRLN